MSTSALALAACCIGPPSTGIPRRAAGTHAFDGSDVELWPTCVESRSMRERLASRRRAHCADGSFAERSNSSSSIAQLSRAERWRVRRYLGSLDGASYGLVPAPSRPPPAERVRGSLLDARNVVLFHSTADVAEGCGQLARSLRWNRTRELQRGITGTSYHVDMCCLLGVHRSHDPPLCAGSSASLVWAWSYGDKIVEPTLPHLAKVRPVSQTSPIALLPLSTGRHSGALNTMPRRERAAGRPFAERGACAVWRGASTGNSPESGTDGYAPDAPRELRAPRRVLVERWHNASLAATRGVAVDVGYSALAKSAKLAPHVHGRYVAGSQSVEQMMACRYLISVEGNDVATGLKWMLYTESVVLMAHPTKETWALEGALVPWTHYVPLARDYEDLAERLAWCEANLERAAAIARAGRAHLRRVFGGGPDAEARVISAVLDGFQAAVQYRFGTEHVPAHARSGETLAMYALDALPIAKKEAAEVAKAFSYRTGSDGM